MHINSPNLRIPYLCLRIWKCLRYSQNFVYWIRFRITISGTGHQARKRPNSSWSLKWGSRHPTGIILDLQEINRLINAIACPWEVSETLILTTLHSLLGILNKDTTTSIRRNIKKLTVPAKKHHRPAFNEKDLCDFLGISPEEANKVAENTSQDFGSSLCQYFSREITVNSLIAWRVRSPSIQVILLNNYDSETGDFKVNLPSRNEWKLKSSLSSEEKKYSIKVLSLLHNFLPHFLW